MTETRRAVTGFVVACALLALSIGLTVWNILGDKHRDDRITRIEKRVVKAEKQAGKRGVVASNGNSPSGQPAPPSGGGGTKPGGTGPDPSPPSSPPASPKAPVSVDAPLPIGVCTPLASINC